MSTARGASLETRVVRWAISPRGAARGRTSREAVLLRYNDGRGGVGFGEAAPLPGMSVDTLADVAAALAELDARELESHVDAPARHAVLPASLRFAIETAVLSARAYRANRSLASLLGTLPAAPLRCAPVVDTVDEACAAWSAGATIVKVKVGPTEMSKLAALAAARPDLRFRVDANQSWPDRDVHALVAEASRFTLDYIEEPCRDARVLLHDSRVMAPIALDDSLVGISDAELAELHLSPQLAAVVLKPTLHGLLRTVAIAGQSRRAIISHALEGPVGMAACCELALAVGNLDDAMGLASHGALDNWSIATPQLDGLAIHPAGRGLGFDAAHLGELR